MAIGEAVTTHARAALIDKPWTLKVEFTKGCNLACRFCPIYAEPALYAEKQYHQPAFLKPFAQEYGRFVPNTRIELTLRGEPTLNPQAEELLRILRQYIPRAQVSLFTNGVRILQEPALVGRLLDAGVNILNIDCYNRTYDRFRRLVELELPRIPGARLTDFRSFSAYRRHPNGHRLRCVNLVPDIADADRLVAVRVIHNNAGNADPEQLRTRWGIQPIAAPLHKGCARPFREFVLYHDGSVVVCCHDWKAEAVIGRFPQQSVEAIWYGDAHLAMLRSLYRKDRSGVPCNRCDYHGGYRLGLLRNPLGEAR